MRGAKPARALELAIGRARCLADGEVIAIACSGGPDSVALAALLHAVAPKRGWKLCLAHVNHGLRASAWQDEAIVLRVGAALALPVRIVALGAGPADEAALRNARHAALVRVAQATRSAVIVTGHTCEDQSETVLLALFRGTGSAGLRGIAARRPLAAGVDLCRPLLRWEHASLQHYCQVSGLPYALDPTNAGLQYRRNVVRAALEAVRPSFPGLDRAVARAAEVIADESAGDERALLRRRVRTALRDCGGLVDVDFEHVESAVRALEGAGSGEFHMGPKVNLTVRRGKLAVNKRP